MLRDVVQSLLRLRRGFLPGAFLRPCGRGLFLAKVCFYTLRDEVPDPFIASGGAPFLLAERGKRPPKGRIPFGNPYGQTNSGLRLRGTKGRSRLRNRSLVVPDKVPSGGFVCGVPSRGIEETAAGTQTQERHPLFGRPPGPPLRGTDLAHSRRRPKGAKPLWKPHGQTHSGLRLRGTKGRSRLRNRSLVALIGCLRRILGYAVGKY